MFSHVAFGILVLIYYMVRFVLRAIFGSPRRNRRLRREMQSALQTLASHHGGTVRPIGRRIFRWILPDGASAEIQRSAHPRLFIHIPLPFQGSITFQRLPRMIHAFVEAFLPEDSHVAAHPYYVTASAPHLLEELKERSDFLRLFETLSREGYSLRLNPGGLTAWKRVSDRETNDLILYEQIRLLRDLGRICSRALIPVQPLQSAARCAYCHEEASLDVVYCAGCGSPHHQECFELNGRCSIFGCGSSRPVQVPELVRM